MGATSGIQKKKPKNLSREAQLSSKLTSFSKSKDLRSALSLYDVALADNTSFNQQHLNSLLYICSASLDSSAKALAIDYGYEIFKRMVSSGVKPNEACVTAMVRIASARPDGDYAFELVRRMKDWGLIPRLRTCSPVLLCFCEELEAEKAYEVEEHVNDAGVNLEEVELAALLRVSSETGRPAKVYEYLQKLRAAVGCVREETSKIIADWFERFDANGHILEENVVKEALSRNGGGWHGLGWLGQGRWTIQGDEIEEHGDCLSCGERLVGVDIDNTETERFAASVASLAMEREVVSNFSEFQSWLDEHGDFEAIVDGANVGLYQQNFAKGGFSVSQLDAVVKELHEQRKKKPLIILHNKRVRALYEDAKTRVVVDEWIKNGFLHATPPGSNDDWYWLYAAIRLKCYLVTNDEMRDHIFELLNPSFFLKWKDRHQVRYTFAKGSLTLHMPPPYSSVIQESELGSWHVPFKRTDGAKSWLCITRHRTLGT